MIPDHYTGSFQKIKLRINNRKSNIVFLIYFDYNTNVIFVHEQELQKWNRSLHQFSDSDQIRHYQAGFDKNNRS